MPFTCSELLVYIYIINIYVFQSFINYVLRQQMISSLFKEGIKEFKEVTKSLPVNKNTVESNSQFG